MIDYLVMDWIFFLDLMDDPEFLKVFFQDQMNELELLNVLENFPFPKF